MDPAPRLASRNLLTMKNTTTLLLLAAVALTAPRATANIGNSPTAPTDNLVFQGVSDGGSTSVRWRTGGDDTDLGATFLMGGQTLTLDAITVRISPQDLGAAVPGMPVMLDFYAFDGTTSFTPLWRATANLPATTVGNDYLRWDLSGQNQTLLAGASYAFLFGANAEDMAPNSMRIRLFTSASNQAADTFEIRREFEFGANRPDLSVAPNLLNVNRDLLFYVQAIPEPATASLLLLGLLALAATRARGRRA